MQLDIKQTAEGKRFPEPCEHVANCLSQLAAGNRLTLDSVGNDIIEPTGLQHCNHASGLMCFKQNTESNRLLSSTRATFLICVPAESPKPTASCSLHTCKAVVHMSNKLILSLANKPFCVQLLDYITKSCYSLH